LAYFVQPRVRQNAMLGGRLAQLGGRTIHQEKLVTEIQAQVKAEYAALKEGEKESQHRRFLSQLWKYQEEHVFYLPTGEQFLGVIQGVRKDGQLAISRENKMYFFGNKEVIFFYGLEDSYSHISQNKVTQSTTIRLLYLLDERERRYFIAPAA
jgi:hypothetical protein